MDEGGSREMIDLTKSKAAFEEAKKYMPGGVNSPVRSYPHMAVRLLSFRKPMDPISPTLTAIPTSTT